MLKVVNGEAPKTKKLILGFDAGCGTCADLAAGVQEKVGDKLEVQNLNDPQLLAWREEALGKDAKWTPTLFEVEGEKVLRAWAGWRMGYALSRKLGPSSTWQVMQALGEIGGAPKVEESAVVEKLPERAAEAVVGMSRGQFLKGVGGAAVAASVLSSGMLFPSVAEAATSLPNKSTGTLERRNLAKRIVVASNSYKSLAVAQRNIGAGFDWRRAMVNADQSDLAIVRVGSYHKQRSFAVVFIVDVRLRKVWFRQGVSIVPHGTSEVKVTRLWQGRPARPHRQMIFGVDKSRSASPYVITEDGKRMSAQQFVEDCKRIRRTQQSVGQIRGALAVPNTFRECVDNANKNCKIATGIATGNCAIATGASAGLSIVAPPVGIPVTIGVFALCAAVGLVGCPDPVNLCDRYLKNRQPPPSSPAPPKGNC